MKIRVVVVVAAVVVAVVGALYQVHVPLPLPLPFTIRQWARKILQSTSYDDCNQSDDFFINVC